MTREAVDKLLDAVEGKEEVSLRWGDVDASLSRDEILELAIRVSSDCNPEQLVEQLIGAVLLYEFEIDGSPRYRSRFGETMRLLSRLRQIFPNENWRGSPLLVADFRVDRRPRRYPRRDRDAIAIIRSITSLSQLQKAAAGELVKSVGRTPNISRFQEDALLRVLETSNDQGTIITAGTGSGKTLAFYLPALTRISETVGANDYWVRALAIYPRNELLKDQITEAYRLVSSIRTTLIDGRRRSLRVGAFYGDTPLNATEKALERAKWVKRRDRWVCPYLRCPSCQGELVWLHSDVLAAVERLTCDNSCGATIHSDAVVLTRERILAEPPDILFTTTEMLNQRLSDTKWRKVFGVGEPKGRCPYLLLLDEVHTYSGPAGAQAALTLRRWRALLSNPVSWVGLSATLLDASRFFSDLAGLDPWRVLEITPSEEEMMTEGREYQVILRGDPASRESLLSSSIQAIMLLGRMLDPSNGPSEGRYGRRLFAFTDDLDVTNRLYDNLSDAEAYDAFGRADQRRLPLAHERAARPAESARNAQIREENGQRWELPEKLGRPLNDRLVIGRTTSRDPGVDGRADVIVATASLEVGFNDPLVGTIVQHKAPRSFAAFVQRKGRAGRDRRMRPLTVTVLSDYGQDRNLFQSYELLFEPTLVAQSLPIRNQYILRMQATYALFDWLADQHRPPGIWNGWLWRDGSQPLGPDDNGSFRKNIQDILSDLLSNRNNRLDSLRVHLERALRIEREEVEQLLWEAPRSILLEAVPTLLRRLFRNFSLAWPHDGGQFERHIPNHPLPEFVPRALFSDLSLPEVEFSLPPDTARDEPRSEFLPILQAITQLAPGRVNRRFGEGYGNLAHWFPVPPGVTEYDLPVQDYAEAMEFVGRFQNGTTQCEGAIPVFRPWRIRLEKANKNQVKPSSNSRPIWASGFVVNGAPIIITTPTVTVWRALVSSMRAYLSQFHASVGVRRFATGAVANIRRAQSVSQNVEVRFVHEGQPAAVGFEIETDGLALDIVLPTADDISRRALDTGLEAAIRTAYHRQLMANDTHIPKGVNIFERNWLRQIHFCASARRALGTGTTLLQSSEVLANSGDPTPFEDILDKLLGVQSVIAEDATDASSSEEDDAEPTGPRSGRLERLKDALRQLLLDPLICQRLNANTVEAFGLPSIGRSEFIRQTLETTLANAALAAVTNEAPRHAKADSLLVDIERSLDPTKITVWISETVLGGGGVLQAVVEEIANEPRRLFRSIEATLETSELETAGAALIRAVWLAATNEEIADAIAELRKEPSHDRRAEHRRQLLQLLERNGIDVSRAFTILLSIRLLAPGTNRDTDVLTNQLFLYWDAVEDTLRVNLEPREVALLAIEDEEICRLGTLANLFDLSTPESERVAILWSLLWPRTDKLRTDSLSSWNPFQPALWCSPELVRALILNSDGPVVSLSEAQWHDLVNLRLAENGTARISATIDQRELFRNAIIELQARSVTIGHLRLYPVLERISRRENDLIAAFVLRERV
jgi:hypothetical protein